MKTAHSTRMEHDNGDETHVLVYSVDDGDTWVGVAVDVGPDLDGQASEVVAVTATRDEAVARAERWADENEKGILGEESGGLLDRLANATGDV